MPNCTPRRVRHATDTECRHGGRPSQRARRVGGAHQREAARRAAQDAKGWKPALPRPRKVSTALKAYALLATSADKGGVRDKAMLEG